MALSKRLRYEILRRDEYACSYCGASAPDVKLHVDHVVPEALGGTSEPENLTAACVDCNAGKASTSPDEPTVAAVDERARQWVDAMKRASEEARSSRTAEVALAERFTDVWKHRFTNTTMLPAGLDRSLARFLEAGLDRSDLDHAMNALSDRWDSISSGDEFRYYCGICWKMIADRNERAMEILGAST